MNRTPLPTDAAALVESLDPERIAARLDEIAAEERALRVLLRSARARQQARSREQREGRDHAGR